MLSLRSLLTKWNLAFNSSSLATNAPWGNFQISFSRTGHDDFIDFLKGVCIIMVLLTHGLLINVQEYLLYPLWIAQAVPIFLLIQAFHAFKKDRPAFPRPSHIWTRILRPFLIVQIIFLVHGYLQCQINHTSFPEFLTLFRRCGGLGPGSYYIWIYLQFALLLPLSFRLLQTKYALPLFLFLSIALEIACSLTHILPEHYRLLFFRYFFLIYLGYLWAKKGISLNILTLSLSAFSILAILLLYGIHKFYPSLNLEPFIFDTNWRIFHWFTYFLPAFLLPFLFRWTYHKLSKRINAFIILCGKRSYHIFLFQMLVFGIFNQYVSADLKFLFIPLCLLPALLPSRFFESSSPNSKHTTE